MLIFEFLEAGLGAGAYSTAFVLGKCFHLFLKSFFAIVDGVKLNAIVLLNFFIRSFDCFLNCNSTIDRQDNVTCI